MNALFPYFPYLLSFIRKDKYFVIGVQSYYILKILSPETDAGKGYFAVLKHLTSKKIILSLFP